MQVVEDRLREDEEPPVHAHAGVHDAVGVVPRLLAPAVAPGF
jgi:hypothetical protein